MKEGMLKHRDTEDTEKDQKVTLCSLCLCVSTLEELRYGQ